MTNKHELQIPKIIRKEDGTYLAKFEIEGTSKEELEEVFKRVEKTKWWNDETFKANIGDGFKKGKIKDYDV